ncbi:hypothetical protein ACFLRB_05425 [Acidobacteriota bacterium]
MLFQVMTEISDPIVAEVRKARNAYAKKFNYDIKAMCRDIKKRQAENPDRIVSLPPKRIMPESTPKSG